MSALPHPPAVQLRMYAPPPPETDRGWTIQAAFDEFVQPELGQVAQSTRDEYFRALEYWHRFELLLADEATAQSSHSAHPCSDDPARTRMAYPSARDGGRAALILTELSTRLVTQFRDWIVSPANIGGLGLSASVANRAFSVIKRTVAKADDEGIAVATIRTKPLPVKAAPKRYFSDEEIDRLWAAAERQLWPDPQPAVFWRSILILLRTYGMRVQDLVAYTGGKQPITWAGIHYHSDTPDPDGRAEWHLGWLHYTASKTGREYYLPLTPSARSAIDRLRTLAARSLDCDPRDIPLDRPILPCPRGRSLNEHWRMLQAAADVRNKGGKLYVLEDFRKTAATYLSEHNSDLPYCVCGWSIAKSAVAAKHYIHSERTLVKYLPTAPMPQSFSQWLD